MKAVNNKNAKGIGNLSRIFQLLLAVACVGFLLVPFILEEEPWPQRARDYLQENAIRESGAKNTVSAIYLGYRIFDTLGETIVLLAAISGTIMIIGYKAAADKSDIESPSGKKKIYRTNLLEVVTGKLGPVVLVFGVYVMLYGHLSPGGGFQGGVVIASGIVFLAMGGSRGAAIRLTEAGVLAGIEASSFLLLILAALLGTATQAGFFGNIPAVFGLNPVSFIVFLNAVIGLKVGAGMGFMCIVMLERAD